MDAESRYIHTDVHTTKYVRDLECYTIYEHELFSKNNGKSTGTPLARIRRVCTGVQSNLYVSIALQRIRTLETRLTCCGPLSRAVGSRRAGQSQDCRRPWRFCSPRPPAHAHAERAFRMDHEHSTSPEIYGGYTMHALKRHVPLCQRPPIVQDGAAGFPPS